MNKVFYCLVVGTRTYSNYYEMQCVLDKLLATKVAQGYGIVIVSGGAAGADRLAEVYAHRRGYMLKVFPANWDEYGKGAGYVRNREMHEYIASNNRERGVVAFWDGKSKGTAHNFTLSKEFDTRIVAYNYTIGGYVRNCA